MSSILTKNRVIIIKNQINIVRALDKIWVQFSHAEGGGFAIECPSESRCVEIFEKIQECLLTPDHSDYMPVDARDCD